jgi:Putative MetA-pathway of phenol degradation
MSPRYGVFCLGVLSITSAVQAQDTPLSRLLPDLLARAVVTPSSRNVTTGGPGIPHEAHFLPALAQTSAAYDLNRSIVTYLATFPIGSSSGGFTYEADPGTGIPKRSSGNFGPSFAERALTVGKGQFSAGFNFQTVRYDRFEGLELEDANASSPGFYLEHNDCCIQQLPDGTPGPGNTPKDPAFEGDLLRMALGLKLKSSTAAFFANYGLTDRLDVGVAVPLVKVELDATIFANLQRLSGTNPLIHTFVANQDVSQATFTSSGSASGIGDVVIRTKYNFLHQPGGGLAAGLDLRLPTGDKEDLLGTGATQTKLYLIYSGDFGRVSPHFNGGYTFSSGDLASGVGFEVPTGGFGQTVFARESVPPSDLSVPDEINYAGGLSVSASPRVTVNVDVIGRMVRDANRFGVVSRTFQFRTSNGGPVQSAQRSDVIGITGKGNLTALLGVAGVKVNLTRTFLLTGNVLFPLNDAGLRAKVAPVLGIDYAF